MVFDVDQCKRCNGAEDYKTVAEYIHSQTRAEPKGEAEPVVVGEDDSAGNAPLGD